jgi:hypothetical protein
MPGGSAHCWKGRGGGCEGWAKVGVVTGAGHRVVFQEKALVVQPAVDVGVMV